MDGIDVLVLIWRKNDIPYLVCGHTTYEANLEMHIWNQLYLQPTAWNFGFQTYYTCKGGDNFSFKICVNAGDLEPGEEYWKMLLFRTAQLSEGEIFLLFSKSSIFYSTVINEGIFLIGSIIYYTISLIKFW